MAGLGTHWTKVSGGNTVVMRYNTNWSEAKAVVICPYCGSTDTEPFSLFGKQLLTMQYYCNACRTPFERIKDDDVLDDYAARKEEQA